MQDYAWIANKQRRAEIRNKYFSRSFMFSAVFLGIVFLDQLTKFFTLNYFYYGDSKEIIKNFLDITPVKNTGIAFGLFQGANVFLIVLALIVLVLLFSFRKVFLDGKLSAMGLVFMFSGITGNLIDRIRLGYVVDFIDIKFWPVFNFGDAFLVLGVILLCIQYFSKSDF